MKKFLVMILACICMLTLFGCTDKNEANNNEENSNETDNNETDNNEIDYDNPNGIVFTAKEPIYPIDYSNTTKTTVFYKEGTEIGDHISPFVTYENFKDEYNANIKDKIDGKYYLLKPCDGSYECSYRLNSWYKFYSKGLIDGKHVNPHIEFWAEINKNDFESMRDDSDSDTTQDNSVKEKVASLFEEKYASSITLKLIINPIDAGAETEENEISVEFGYFVDEKRNHCRRNYINIYNGDTCFATCYYDYSIFSGSEPWTEEWFENYFKNYLILQA